MKKTMQAAKRVRQLNCLIQMQIYKPQLQALQNMPKGINLYAWPYKFKKCSSRCTHKKK